jgi:hypothetical protein
LISVREIDAGGFQRDDGRGHRGEGFAADTASQAGVNNSSVNRAISRAKAIPGDIRAIIKGMVPGREFGCNSLQSHWIPPIVR